MEPSFFSNRPGKSKQWLVLTMITATLTMFASSLGAAPDEYAGLINQTHLFYQPLVWVGARAPTEAESQALWETMEGQKLGEAVNGLETFVEENPNSPWTPSLRGQLADYYFQNGYFTPALENWQAVWEATKYGKGRKERSVADDALVHWLQLLASLGRTDTMKQLFDETAGRQITPEFQPLYQRSRGVYAIMLRHPEFSYRCGTYALCAVAQTLGASNFFHQIWEQPSPPTGFSMADLVKLSEANHLNLVAVDRTEGQELVVPSVVHWKLNHYAAIVGRRGDFYEVVDPTFQMIRWLSADAINEECSGQFLVPASQRPADWQILNQSETSQIFGKGYPAYKVPLGCSPSGGSGTCPVCTGPGSSGSGGSGHGSGSTGGSPGCVICSNGGLTAGGGALVGSEDSNIGMPSWTVTEPGCDVWLQDQPLEYQPSKGPKISFALNYSQEVYDNASSPVWTILDWINQGDVFTLGENWYPSWLSFAAPDNIYGPVGTVGVLAPGGGIRTYTNFDGTAPEFNASTRMLMETNLDGSPSGFRVLYPSGAQDVYEEAYDYAFFLSQQIDPRGNTTTYIYSTNSTSILLQYVIDGDGKTNTFTYTNIIAYENEGCGPSEETNSCYVSQITDPYGRTVKFNYPGNGTILTNYNGYMGLTNIVDPTGISSSFYYTNGAVIQLTTPYGNTAFYYWNDWYEGGNSEMMLVTEPNGSHQMFLYAGDEYGYNNYLSAIPTVYTDPSYVPTNPPVDNSQGGNTLDNPDWNNPDANDYMRWANSFYWGRQQFANLSSTFLATSNSWDPTALTVNDYALPRLRHWLQTPDQAQGNSLSMERDPSPDGATPGEMTWYDYPGKSDFYIQGTLDTPTLKIKVLPDGTEQYEIYQLDQWGHPTNVISTYSVNGTILLRTNSYIYSTNGIDLLASIGPDGVTDASYAYDTNHQVLFMTNALGEVTCYTYNTYEQPTSIIQPNGLVTTNIYGSDGFLAQQIVIGYSTNSYTYTNGLVYTHTDERGLTTTNTWDALNRLVKVSYPDGTFTSYIYSNLDLVETVDRLGFHTYYGYNPIEQKIAETNALGNVTRYNYCQCGALESIEDALDNVTYFTHDNQGNLTQTTYPDGYTVDNTYNLLRQLITTTDSGGMSVTNTYNNQGLLTASRNNAGLVKSLTYDVDDRITNAVDDNDVSVNMTYDNLDRLLTRSYPDGGVEKWGYTPDVPGPTGYTNQIGNVTLYGYDAMDRKTNEVFVGVTTNKFAYDGASDLLALTDGKNDTTSWVYDSYGRMTNKVDAADNLLFVYRYDADNRLTNRWSAAKGSTIYSYDAVGNLTHVAYPVSPAISLSYDALNRLTNMVDAVGTTVYTYNQVGQLLSEGGLWPDDTVSYTYANRLRTGLSLLAPNASAWKQSYGYDSARRLTSVTSPAGSFDYTYDRSQLLRVDKLSLPNGAYITNTYDSTARLTGTYLKNGDNANLDSYAYGYNLAGERTNVVRTTGDYVNYTYDNEGELVTANAKEPGGVTNRWQEQFGYAYDAAGNLNNRTNNALVQTFGVNNLNELTGAARVGNLTVAGTTTSPATNVTVNSQMASLYADATFAATNFTLADGDNTFTAIARDSYGRMDTNSITVNLPATNSFSYDLNGNLLSDGTRSFGYDDENELISVCVSNNWSNSFVYDGKMRRRIEKDYAWNGSSWQQTNEVHFVYDGNVVIQERNGNNLPQVSYTRGNDLSGTLQGAGGIGGLLSRSDNSQMLAGDTSAHAYYHADGSGNITMMLNPSQAIVAKYLYDPFGNTLSMSGTLAEVNVYRFSSKEWNDNAGLYYYLYRFYDPNLQRWPNRDPLGDAGSSLYGPLSKHRNYFNPVFDAVQQKDGLNLYEMARNNPIDSFDQVGLDCGGPGGQAACGVACTLACAWCALLPPIVDFVCAGTCMASCGAACCADQDSCPNNPNPPRKKRGSGL